MTKGIEHKTKWYALIAALAAVNSGIYGIVYLRNSYYNVMQEAIGLTHTQMGNIWSVYGIVASISYIVGGWLADRYNGKMLIGISLTGVVACGFYLRSLPSYYMLMLTYALMGVFAIGTYYAVSIKIVTKVGTHIGQGKAFGTYWTLIYLVNALATLINIWQINYFGDESRRVYRFALMVFIVLSAIAFAFFMSIYKEGNSGSEADRPPASFLEMCGSLKDIRVISIALIVFTNYLIMSSFSYFVPYMRNYLGYTQAEVLAVNLIRGEVLGTVATFVVGVITDRIHSALKLIRTASLIAAAILIALVLATGEGVDRLIPVILLILVNSVISGSKGVTMVIPTEVKIPPSRIGQVVGIVSFIGYLPDAFYYTFAGKIIDARGNDGYSLLFMISAAIAVICSLICHRLYKSNLRGE